MDFAILKESIVLKFKINVLVYFLTGKKIQKGNEITIDSPSLLKVELAAFTIKDNPQKVIF